MGNVTEEFQIWTPDEDNAVEPDVYLAAMAKSIEDGMGKRVLKQEQRAFLNTQINNQINLPGDNKLVRIPLYKTEGEGINLNGSIVEILTSGLYFISPTIEAGFVPEEYAIDYVVRLNGAALDERHDTTSKRSYTSMNINQILPLHKGDKLWLEARIGAPGSNPPTAKILVRSARFPLAMLYAF